MSKHALGTVLLDTIVYACQEHLEEFRYYITALLYGNKPDKVDFNCPIAS